MVAHVGDIELVSLSDGEGVFPSGFDSVFPDVPAAELAPWRAGYPAAVASETHEPAPGRVATVGGVARWLPLG